MALKKTIKTDFGFEVKDSYIRVEGVRVEKNKIQFQVRASVDGVKPHFADFSHECEYVLESDNPIKQAYKYLKTLSEFENAVDC